MVSLEKDTSCSVSFDDYDDILYTPLPPRTPSPLQSAQNSSRQTYSTWSSASRITQKSFYDIPSIPALGDHHIPVPRLSSFTTPSLELHFTPQDIESEMSLLTWSRDPWGNSSMDSVSIYSCQDQQGMNYLQLHKLVLDQAWECDKRMMTSNWVSGLGSFHDDRTYMACSDVEPVSIVNKIRNSLQNIRWRLSKGQTKTTSVQILKPHVHECVTSKQGENKDFPSCSGSKCQVKTMRKRIQKFLSRVFICGKPCSD